MSTGVKYFGLAVIAVLAGCGSDTDEETTQGTASGLGCCQLNTQCTDAPRKAQCDAVGGVFHAGKECNSSTHRCE